MKKLLRRSLIMITVFLLAVTCILWFKLPDIVLKPARTRPNTQHPELYPAYWSLQPETISLTTAEGDSLSAWYIRSKAPEGILILLHGIGGCKEQMLGMAADFNKEGFDIVLMDLRAQGASQGEYCTYGFNEKADVSRLIDLLEQKEKLPIGIFGHSLGGAISIQALAIDKRIKFGIIESVFNDLTSVVRAYTHRFIGFSANGLADFARWRAGQVASFPDELVSPMQSASLIEQPLLMIHGTNDTHIPMYMGEQVFGMAASKNKRWIEVDGADHNNLGLIGGATLHRQIMKFAHQQFALAQP